MKLATRWWKARSGFGGLRLVVTVAVLVAGLGLPIDLWPAGLADGTSRADAATGRATEVDVPAGPPDVLPAGGSWTVTLLTGDLLDVRADSEGRVTAVARESAGAVRTVVMPDGELYVIPLSVTPLLQRVLDVELFNVTGLVRQGYDDESQDVVPLIVQREAGVDLASTLSTAPNERPLPSIGAVATSVAKADAPATGELLAELAASAEPRARSAGGIVKVWLDRQVTGLTVDAPSAPSGPRQAPATLDTNLTQVGADRAWAAGLTGRGVTVAVLDTGIDSGHPDLAGKVVAEQNFSSSPDTADHVGHGTHVAAIAAGSGAGVPGTHSGVAPDARLVNAKVVDNAGFGSMSQAIAGMEWAAPQADVVNMSLGYGDGSDGSDPISLALDALAEQHDTLFVVAAGNNGPFSGTVEFPGAADRALTVGAVDASDAVATFSSRGPLAGSFELKPEIVAPGVDIVAARAEGGQIGRPVDEHYTSLSGTSMAAPHAAGAAAVLAEQHPDWSATELKSQVVASADPVEGDGYDTGAGRLDIGDGVDATVQAELDVVDMSLPHPRTAPHRETLTWTNTGPEPVTLALSAGLEDRRGDPVDEAVIAPTELTVAPGASGTATLTVDGEDLDSGLYAGVVTADPAGPGPQDDLRTPVAVYAGTETAELTIEATAPSGTSGPPASFAAVINLDDLGLFGELLFFEDRATVSVPAGRYSVIGDVSSQDPDAMVVAQVGDPDITVDGDTTVAFDGAAAVPFHPSVEGVDTAPPRHTISRQVVTPSAGAGGKSFDFGIVTDHPLPPVRLAPMEGDPAHFSASQIFRLQAPHLTGRIGGDSGEEIELVEPARPTTLLAEGTHALTPVDAGDGEDLSAARGQMAVVRVPDDPFERAAVTQRAADADVALLAFVDEQRERLTLDAFLFPDVAWADVPAVTVAGTSASSLLTAASNGNDVTATVAASPYVYDVVTPFGDRVEPEPVITRADRARMARVDERFHRNADGTGANAEWRYPASLLVQINAPTHGPLPQRRTAYVTPGITWLTYVGGPVLRPGFGGPPESSPSTAVTGAAESYTSGSRQTVTFLRPPQRPGPVGGPDLPGFYTGRQVRRSADQLRVHLQPFQDAPDRVGSASPLDATMALERDGEVLGTAEGPSASSAVLPMPADPGTYRLSYEQTGQAPYPHRSTTAWTFSSAAPSDPAAEELIPLLVVDYELPLDTLNRLTGRDATFVVHQVTGTRPETIRSLKVWASTDAGATWHPAPTYRRDGGRFRITLPAVDDGVPVSLRVDARDAAGNRIEQTLYDTYVG